jgi:hypothetical protein
MLHVQGGRYTPFLILILRGEASPDRFRQWKTRSSVSPAEGCFELKKSDIRLARDNAEGLDDEAEESTRKSLILLDISLPPVSFDTMMMAELREGKGLCL